jgi:hypothetical protein
MAGSVVHSYAADKVLVIVAGIPMTGFGPDTFVNIEPNADLSTMQVGADGEVARSTGTNKTCRVTLTLQQTSTSNDVLSGLMEADALTGNGVFPLTVQDLRGRTVFMATQAWLSKRPAISFGAEADVRNWELTTGTPAAFFVGGNF